MEGSLVEQKIVLKCETNSCLISLGQEILSPEGSNKESMDLRLLLRVAVSSSEFLKYSDRRNFLQLELQTILNIPYWMHSTILCGVWSTGLLLKSVGSSPPNIEFILLLARRISMAEMFVSAVVSELVNKAASLLTGNCEMQRGVKDKLERLEELLVKIHSAVEAAEGRQIKNPSLLRWLRRLKDAAYEADDVLDTFDYRILEQRANEDDGKVSSSFAPSSSNSAKRVRTAARSLFSCDEEVHELSSVVAKLERIAADVEDFLKLLELDGSAKKPELFISSRITSSLLPAEPIGREKEKEDIIKLILQSESDAAGNVSVIPILGIGGVGKTTLAQLVCRDERVKQHFSLIMWVCVSDSFDVFRLTREILEQASRNCNPGCIENFNKLQVTLKEKLRSERFLLVLDDVWNENERNVWEQLRTPLLSGKEGSKIIVTSRLQRVAELMGTKDPIKLDGLPDDEYLSLFTKCAFGDVDPDKHPKLLVIAEEIAKRLKGSPLAAKTLGTMLKDNLNEEHWQRILKSDIWELEQGQNGIIPVLKLSYQHLPVHLQRCFAYCSLFPKDWEYNRKDMIYMWIAEGLIHNNGSEKRRKKDIGEEYIDNLISKAFFQLPYYGNGWANKEIWKIHDLLHDLAESVSKDVYHRINDGEAKEIPDTVRHLTVMTTNLAGLTKYSSVLRHLRTLNFLFYHMSDVIVTNLHDVLEKLKSVRVLNLAHCHLEELPVFTYDLIHVRYLNLSYTRIKVLPDQLCKFYHLESLILKGLELDRVPANMDKLINLCHLWVDEVPMISNIGKLTCLDELKYFNVEKRRGFEIGQLKDLSKLRGSLWIRNLENVESKGEASEARLSGKMNVVDLELAWGDAQQSARYEVVEEVLEGLQPHPNLKFLKIISYSGVRSPSWLMENYYLKNLVSLELSGCKKWKELPPLGQLLSLKILLLSNMHAIEEVGRGFYGSGVVKGFPSLRNLSLNEFPELKEWCAIEHDQMFPSLHYLDISNCSKLRSLPHLPPTLGELELRRVGITLLPAFRRSICPSSAFLSSSSLPSSSSSLRKLTILKCPNLENVDEWSKEEEKKLSRLRDLHTSCPNIYLLPPSLDSLEIEDSNIEDVKLSMCLQRDLSLLRSMNIKSCPHITTLPSANVLQRLTNLSSLRIEDCGELRSIGGLRELVSISHLKVFGCPKLTSLDQSVEHKISLPSVSKLTRLDIDNPLLLNVLLSKEGRSSLRHLEVKGANELTTFTTKLEGAFQHLTSLTALSFKDCNSLQCLPTSLKYLPLENLWVRNCPNFQSLLGKEALPPSQKLLYVENCHPVLKERYGEEGPDRHAIAHISRICIDGQYRRNF